MAPAHCTGCRGGGTEAAGRNEIGRIRGSVAELVALPAVAAVTVRVNWCRRAVEQKRRQCNSPSQSPHCRITAGERRAGNSAPMARRRLCQPAAIRQNQRSQCRVRPGVAKRQRIAQVRCRVRPLPVRSCSRSDRIASTKVGDGSHCFRHVAVDRRAGHGDLVFNQVPEGNLPVIDHQREHCVADARQRATHRSRTAPRPAKCVNVESRWSAAGRRRWFLTADCR